VKKTLTVSEAGRRGGEARGRNLSPERLREIGRTAIASRTARKRGQLTKREFPELCRQYVVTGNDLEPIRLDTDEVLGLACFKVG
jgi:hypothetical protein